MKTMNRSASFQADKYSGYARECLRLADQTDNEARRDQLLDLSLDFYRAAANEEYALVMKKRAA
jgi:hypothetical protein